MGGRAPLSERQRRPLSESARKDSPLFQECSESGRVFNPLRSDQVPADAAGQLVWTPSPSALPLNTASGEQYVKSASELLIFKLARNAIKLYRILLYNA